MVSSSRSSLETNFILLETRWKIPEHTINSSTSMYYSSETGDELILAERFHSIPAFVVSALAPQGRV